MTIVQPSILPNHEYEEFYYQSDKKQQRRIVRSALAAWRIKHPEHAQAKPVNDGWYGWVMKSTRIVARVMDDCIVPYLREIDK